MSRAALHLHSRGAVLESVILDHYINLRHASKADARLKTLLDRCGTAGRAEAGGWTGREDHAETTG